MATVSYPKQKEASRKAVLIRSKCAKEEKALRENLSETQIDTMVEDSFPASDPPSTY